MDDILFRIAIVLIVLVVYVYLGKKAAGTLKLSRLNMMSVAFYFMLVMNLAGAMLAYVGLRAHYAIGRVPPEIIDKTFFIIVYVCLMFFVSVIVTNKLFTNKSQEKIFEEFIAKPVICRKDMTGAQAGTIFMMLICLLATAYVFAKLGYIPIMRMLTSSGYEIAVLRSRASRNFTGNIYIKSILMSSLTPFVSYYAYIWYKTTNSKTWRAIWIVLFILSVQVVTYNYEKAPLVTYAIGYYYLNIFLGTVNDNKQFIKFAILAVMIIVFFYVFMLHSELEATIFDGPVGRILFSQIGGMFLHVDCFPARHPYLMGASFHRIFSLIFPGATYRRSARIVMEIFNPQGIQEGTAGVVNTLFAGEAYANFGMTGAIIAPIIFGIYFAVISHLLRKANKRPEIVLLYLTFTQSCAGSIEGGFVDLFYNASYIMLPLWIFWLIISSNSHYTISKYSPKKGSALT